MSEEKSMEQGFEFPDDLVPPKEMMIEASGRGADGLPKTKVGLFFQYVNLEGEPVEDVREVVALDPIINVHKNLSKVFVDLEFPTTSDVYLQMMNDLLVLAYSAESSIDDSSDRFPLVTMTLIPNKYEGRFYMAAYDPALWALTSTGPREENRVLRLVFDDVNFQFLFNQDGTMAQINMDMKAQEEEAEREAERKEKQSGRGTHF